MTDIIEVPYTKPDGTKLTLRYATGEDVPDEITVDEDGPGGNEPVVAKREVPG